MNKRFDFKVVGKTTFWRQLRINPNFLWWQYQIKIFITFLLIIFVLSIGFSLTLNTQNFFNFIKSNLNKIVIHQPNNLQDLQNNINNLVVNLEPILVDLKQKLAPAEYLKKESALLALETLITDLKTLNTTFPQIEIAQNNLLKSADASYLLNYLQQNEKTIIKIGQNLQTLTPEFEHLSLFSHKFKQYQSQLEQLSSHFQSIPILIEAFKIIAGDKNPHYLVIGLQNTNEKRATGGFIGAFIEVLINDGQINKFNYRDIYDYDGQITEKLTPPLLVKKLSANHGWSLRDANYSPDFTKSAQAFMQLYEKSGGESIDTMMVIDQSLVKDILKITGGIDVPEYQLKITADNFDFVVSYMVEGKVNKNNPKNFIKDKLLNQLITQIKNKFSISDFVNLYQQQFNKVQIYSIHPSINQLADILKLNRHLAEKIKAPQQIFINQISISGNKSDAFIEQKIDLNQKSVNDKIQVSLKFNRQHNWSNKQEKQWQWLQKNIPAINIPADELKRILGYGDNHAIFQIFLPKDYKNIHTIPETFQINTWLDEDSQKIVAEFIPPTLKANEQQNLEFSFLLPNSYPSLNLLLN